jgi:hypothetical protein
LIKAIFRLEQMPKVLSEMGEKTTGADIGAFCAADGGALTRSDSDGENATIEELEVAMEAAPNKRSLLAPGGHARPADGHVAGPKSAGLLPQRPVGALVGRDV